MENRKEQTASCRTPGMAGRKALVTFRISLPYNFRPAPQDIQLYGSWSSYETSIPMERDQCAGHGIWKSLGPKGGLEQGAVYGYYYVMDGKHIWYDPGAGKTVKDDRTGKIVNVIEVPIEMASEEDNESPTASATHLNTPGDASGEGLGGGTRERSYEKSHRAKAYEQLTGSAAFPPPNARHNEYTDNAIKVDRIHKTERSPASSSSTIAPISQYPRASYASIRQYEYLSVSPAAPDHSRAVYQSSKSNSQAEENLPPKLSANRKSILLSSVTFPQEISSPAPIQSKKVREEHSSHKPRKKPSFTSYLSRKISVPSLPPSPVPGPVPQGNSVSPYPPPPPPVRHSTFSHLEPNPSTESVASSSKKRWSLLPTSYQSSLPSNPSPSPSLNSPKRKAGRLFSLGGLGRMTPRSDTNSRDTYFTLNASYSSINTVVSHGNEGTRRNRDPSPLDIPPPPDFVVDNLSKRNRAPDSKATGGQEREKKRSLRGLLGAESHSKKRESVIKRWTRSRNGDESRDSECGGSDVTATGVIERGGGWNKDISSHKKEVMGNETPLLRNRPPLPRSFSVASSTHTTGSTAGATIRSYSNFGRESSLVDGDGFVMVGASSSGSESVTGDSLDRIGRRYSTRSMKPTESNEGVPNDATATILTPIVSQAQLKPKASEHQQDFSASKLTRSIPVPVGSVAGSILAQRKLAMSHLSTSLPTPPAPLSINTNFTSYSPSRELSDSLHMADSSLKSTNNSLVSPSSTSPMSIQIELSNSPSSHPSFNEKEKSTTADDRTSSDVASSNAAYISGRVPVGSALTASPRLSLRIKTTSRNNVPYISDLFNDTTSTLRLPNLSSPNGIEDEDNEEGGMFIMRDDELEDSVGGRSPLFPLTTTNVGLHSIEMKMRGLSCLSHLREKSQGEGENKREMLEELGWLGRAVL